MVELETDGPEDLDVRDRWSLRSGEEWQKDLGTAVELQVTGIGSQIGLTLDDAKLLRDQLDQHIANVEKPVPKTREEMATFAREWDTKVEADRAKRGDR